MSVMVEVLNKSINFVNLTDGEIMLLIQLCQPICKKKGEIVFNEGELDDCGVYFIEEGVIKIIKVTEEKRKMLAMFGLGNMFGEMSFFTPTPRSATAVVDEDVILHKLIPSKFEELEHQAPLTAIKILKIFINKLAGRLRQTDEALMQARGKIIIT